jgi:hypothetical protein
MKSFRYGAAPIASESGSLSDGDVDVIRVNSNLLN